MVGERWTWKASLLLPSGSLDRVWVGVGVGRWLVWVSARVSEGGGYGGWWGIKGGFYPPNSVRISPPRYG